MDLTSSRLARRLGAALLCSAFALASGCAPADPDNTFGDDGVPPQNEGQASSVRASPLGPEPAGDPASYPIILVHGFNASPTFSGFDQAIVDALQADGHYVVAADLPPYLPPVRRAPILAQQIDQARAAFCADRFPDDDADACLARTKINIIAHSMGGLDSRIVISGLGYGDRVATLTTVATPHQGSAMADAMLRVVHGERGGKLDALVAVIGQLFSDMSSEADLEGTLEALSETSAQDFNNTYLDDGRVQYFSYAGISYFPGVSKDQDSDACQGTILGDDHRRDLMNPVLVPAAYFTSHQSDLPTDGMVAVPSAIHGQFLGCVPADHVDETHQIDSLRPSPWTGFDNVRFYRNLAFFLAQQGD